MTESPDTTSDPRTEDGQTEGSSRATAEAATRPKAGGRRRAEESIEPESGSQDESPRAADGERDDTLVGEIPDEVRRLEEELERLNDRHLRLAAEFDNFRRRSQSQLGETGTRAQAALVGELLDVLDDFERVTSLDPDQATVESVLEGVRMIEQKLNRALEDAGLEAIEAENSTFDPNAMEAMMKEPTDSEEEDETIARVLQKGFRFKGHLVRPARVSVRKYD